MPLPFPITAVDNPLGPGASSRVDVRTVDGSSTVGYANVNGDFLSMLVAGGEVLFALQDNQQTVTLRSATVGPGGVAASVVATQVRADASALYRARGVVQNSLGDVFGYFSSLNTSSSAPRVALFNASLSTTYVGSTYGMDDNAFGRVGWVSFDDGSIADIAFEVYA